MYNEQGLNMPLKVHVIIHHFKEFFELTGITMQDINGEYVETLHSSLRVHEETHGYKVKREMGNPVHLNKAKKSLTSFNLGKNFIQ